MAATDEILNGPFHNIKEMLERSPRPSEKEMVAGLYLNFIHYAANNWDYGGDNVNGKPLLDGSSKIGDCAAVRDAFWIILNDTLGIKMVEPKYIGGPFLAKSMYSCFDKKATGNVARADSQDNFNQGYIFYGHYTIKWGDLCYDPCMVTTYAKEDDVVECQLTPIGHPDILVGPNRSCLYVRSERRPAGFDSSFILIEEPGELRKVRVDSKMLKAIAETTFSGVKASQLARKAGELLNLLHDPKHPSQVH
jgi:hypothetical protein